MMLKLNSAPDRPAALRVLVVDPSIEDCRRVREVLKRSDHFVAQVARSPHEARMHLETGLFDVAVVDYGVWSEDTSRLMDIIREQHGELAVVLLTSAEHEGADLPTLTLGAHDFVSKALLGEGEQLTARILAAVAENRALRRRDTMVRWLEREARTDHLTGLYNRHAFDERLRDVCRDARARGEAVTIIVLDVGGTAMVNEVHGHETGDDMIRRAAGGIMRCVRGGDFAARVGGDDFGIILPNSDLDLGRLIARRIAQEIERLNVGEWDQKIPVTLTLGVATGRECDPGELFEAAEQQISEYKTVRPVITLLRQKDDSDGPYVA